MKEQNWLKLAAVQLGGAICLPVVLLGQLVAKNYGIRSACLSILIGNLLLFFFLATKMVSKAVFLRKSTAELAVDIFGKQYRVLFIGSMLFNTIAWFSIQLNMMTEILTKLFT